MNEKVAVLVPAHNEEDIIRETIASLMQQTNLPYQVIVISDNSTDRTVEILRELEGKHNFAHFTWFESVNNPDRKGGAMNQGFAKVLPEVEFVQTLDADTTLEPNFIEAGLEELCQNPDLGGVCARFKVLPFAGGNVFQHFLWELQKLEYSWFDSSKIERPGSVMVLSGAGTLFRKPILDELSQERNGKIWVRSPADDYVVTMDLKHKGWQVGTIFNSYASTDAMVTYQSFYKQRYTWFLWSWVELKRRGCTKHTIPDIWGMVMSLIALLGQLWVIGLITTSALSGTSVHWHVLALMVVLLFYVNKLIRLKYVQERSFWETMIVVAYIPEEIYRLCLNFLCLVCLVESLKPKYPNY